MIIHLKLKENAIPQFFKPRLVSFALKEKTAEELNRLERIGLSEKVDFSDWATPIVPVLKADSTTRIFVIIRSVLTLLLMWLSTPCLGLKNYLRSLMVVRGSPS